MSGAVDATTVDTTVEEGAENSAGEGAASGHTSSVNRSVRIAIDESSFDWRELDDAAAQEHLETFSDALEQLGCAAVAKPPFFDDVECRDGLDLRTVAFGPDSPVERDARLRFGLLAQRCLEWDDSIPGLPTEVAVAGAACATAYSIGYAFHHAAHGFGVACLVFGAVSRRGRVAVEADGRLCDVYFFSEHAALPNFWRTLFHVESVAESEFIDLACKAFPHLVFASDLSFRRFEGTYSALWPWVYQTFVMLNDGFPGALREAAGDRVALIKRLGHYGVEVSPESPKTHSNAKAMRERRIIHDGETYDCEWHTKHHKGRPNRIHFSMPDSRLGDRILIGVFAAHLTL